MRVETADFERIFRRNSLDLDFTAPQPIKFYCLLVTAFFNCRCKGFLKTTQIYSPFSGYLNSSQFVQYLALTLQPLEQLASKQTKFFFAFQTSSPTYGHSFRQTRFLNDFISFCLLVLQKVLWLQTLVQEEISKPSLWAVSNKLATVLMAHICSLNLSNNLNGAFSQLRFTVKSQPEIFICIMYYFSKHYIFFQIHQPLNHIP